MSKPMTAGEVASDAGMARENVILQNSFWSCAIDPFFNFESLPIQRQHISKRHQRTRLLDLLRLDFMNQFNGTLLCLTGREVIAEQGPITFPFHRK
jgi:hypothetical protein